MSEPLNKNSKTITAGIARSPNRAMLRAVGFGDNDFQKRIVGVANNVAFLGRLVAGPVRRGEALTDVRLLGPGLLGPGLLGPGLLGPGLLGAASGPSQLVAVPVRVAEPATAALLRAGDRIDVLAASAAGGPAPAEGGPASAAGPAATVVATGLTVLALPPLGDTAGEGALLVLAADRATAARLAAAALTDRLSVAVLPIQEVS